jgi:hypothetical protein
VAAILVNTPITGTTTLSLATQDPALYAVVTATGAIAGGTGDALYGTAAAAWQVQNFGSLSGTTGIALANGGTVVNEAGGTATITGTGYGISISGSPGIVTNNGLIQANTFAGVDLAAGGTVTNGGVIYGLKQGASFGAQPASLDNTGTITGRYVAAASFAAGGTVTNTGTLTGYDGVASGTNLTVTNNGSILGSPANLISAGIYSGGDVTVDNGLTNHHALITSKNYGIHARGSATVTNAGTIGSETTSGLTFYAIKAESVSVTNDRSGVIQGREWGVWSQGSGSVASVSNSGHISGGAYGVDSFAYDWTSRLSLTNTSTGVISGGSAGVVGVTGAVRNLGTITGTLYGPIFDSNYGAIGVMLRDGGSITNGSAKDTTATIGGYTSGIYVRNKVATITNSGTIASNGGSGVHLQAGGTVVTHGTILGYTDAGLFGGYTNHSDVIGLAASSTILGPRDANQAVSYSVVTNSGVMTGHSGDGVYVIGSGRLTNTGTINGGISGVDFYERGNVTNHGLIDGTLGSGVYVFSSTSTVTNSGTITGSNGVTAMRGAKVTNTGSIGGGLTGVADFGILTLTNSGTITGAGAGPGNAGVSATDGSLSNTGSIHGATSGIYGSNAFDATNITNNGAISGGVDGIRALGASYISNGLGKHNASIAGDQHGIALYAGGSVTNAGGISGGWGVFADTGFIRVTNKPGGQITGTFANGVELYAGSILNQGTITSLGSGGDTGAAQLAAVLIDNGAYISNASTGLITAIGGPAIYAGGIGSSTIVNFGTLSAPSGQVDLNVGFGATALLVEHASGLIPQGLYATPGSTLNLELANDGGTASLPGLVVTNASQVSVDPGADWQASGTITAATVLDQGTLASVGTLSVNADISGSGTIALGSLSLFSIAGTVDPASLLFQGGGATLDLASGSSLGATIAGFAASDFIDLQGIGSSVALSTAGDVLTVTPTGGTGINLTFAGAVSVGDFTWKPDSGTGIVLGHV